MCLSRGSNFSLMATTVKHLNFLSFIFEKNSYKNYKIHFPHCVCVCVVMYDLLKVCIQIYPFLTNQNDCI